MANLLLICPDHDQLTRALRRWSADLGYSVVVPGDHAWRALHGGNVTRANVEAALAGRPDAVFFYGHGEADRWLNAGTAITDLGNAHILAGKLVFSVACDSASRLGPEAVTRGARAYIGYDYTFTAPLNQYEASFRRAANAPQIAALSRGRSCGDAVLDAKILYRAAASEIAYGPRRTDYDAMFAAGWLRSNEVALTVVGDASARL